MCISFTPCFLRYWIYWESCLSEPETSKPACLAISASGPMAVPPIPLKNTCIAFSINEKGIIVSKMNKRKLHHIWTKIRPISPWYFLAIALVSGVVFIFAYRHNNVVALDLRDKVLQVD